MRDILMNLRKRKRKAVVWPSRHLLMASYGLVILITAAITSGVVRNETTEYVSSMEIKISELQVQHENDADIVWRQAKIIEASEKMNTAVIDYFKLYGETFTGGKSDSEIDANVKRLVEMRFVISETIKEYEQAKQ